MGAHGQLPEGSPLLLRRPHAGRRGPACGVALTACVLACAMLLVACGAAHGRRLRAGAVAEGHVLDAWTPSVPLSSCAGEHPRVLFPSRERVHPTGPGAVVWNASSSCPEGPGGHLATLDGDDVPVHQTALEGEGGHSLAVDMLAAAPGPHGEIAILAAPPGASEGEGVFQGRADGPFSQLALPGGMRAPFALDTAWLGDLALAAPPAGKPANGVALHIERYFTHDFIRNQLAVPEGGPPQALAVALDYRTDALVAWIRGGYLYARELPGRGAPREVQRVARVSGRVSLSALLSDDYRGILAWSEQSGGRTSLYLDQSAVGVRFGSPRLLESAPTPSGPEPAASPLLVRLSNESVMLAWSSPQDGLWSVRTAAIDEHGIGRPATISPSGADALLSDLAPGPVGEAIALWTEPQAPSEASRQAIFAAPGVDTAPDFTVFGAPEEVAAPAANSEATLAIDPASGRALAVWRDGSGLRYSVRPGAGRQI